LGWKLIPAYFDDGGLSGASLERPALQTLLGEVRARKVDIIVVYKVDRLTRSLADFAKLVELFDEHEVSFVSVTQSFNTTSSMGRLTLNVLLSFAEFEREVIGERVRDKIAASKRKGIWVGGPVPLGYRSKDKKIEIVPEEAIFVRKIFADYLRLGSIGDLAAELNAEGLRPRERRQTNGKLVIAPECYSIGSLAYLLKNRFYVGEVVYRGEIHKGEHEAFLDRDLFEAVRQKLADQAVERKLKGSSSPYLLAGLLFDDRGNRMTPSHANKKGIRYRYYVSQAVLQNKKELAGCVTRVSAPEVEAAVSEALRGRDRPVHKAALDHSSPQDRDGANTGSDLSESDLIHASIAKITIHPTRIDITLKPAEHLDADLPDQDPISLKELSIPFASHHPMRKGIAHESRGPQTINAKTRESLLFAIARARVWMESIISGRENSLGELAGREQIAERYARRLVQLAFLSPKIVEAIDNGTAPAGLTVSRLIQSLPYAWSEQERTIGM
jgi:DNA invertase Pin-like site-specific DNA recombinase